MRLSLAFAAVAMFATGALAQETAPDVPPSTCAAFTPTPSPPDGVTATADQVRAAVAEFEVWRAATQATLDCRSAEVRALAAQAETRRNEYVAAQTENQAGATAFQAQLDIYAARQRR